MADVLLSIQRRHTLVAIDPATAWRPRPRSGSGSFVLNTTPRAENRRRSKLPPLLSRHCRCPCSHLRPFSPGARTADSPARTHAAVATPRAHVVAASPSTRASTRVTTVAPCALHFYPGAAVTSARTLAEPSPSLGSHRRLPFLLSSWHPFGMQVEVQASGGDNLHVGGEQDAQI